MNYIEANYTEAEKFFNECTVFLFDKDGKNLFPRPLNVTVPLILRWYFNSPIELLGYVILHDTYAEVFRERFPTSYVIPFGGGEIEINLGSLIFGDKKLCDIFKQKSMRSIDDEWT